MFNKIEATNENLQQIYKELKTISSDIMKSNTDITIT